MFGRSSFSRSSVYSFFGKVIGDGRSRKSQDFRASCVPLSRLRSFSTGPFLHRRFDRDAIGRGWLAGLRNHQAPAGPWSRRSRAISSRHPSLSRGRTRGGPFRAPQTHRLLLLRVCTVLSPAAPPLSARNPHGLSDLCRTRIPRCRPVPEWPSEPRFAPAIGSRRAFSERYCLGLQRFSIRDDSRSIAGWSYLCRLSWTVGRLCIGASRGDVCCFHDTANQNTIEAAPARAGHSRDDPRRVTVHLAGKGDSGLHLAGSFCRLARRLGGSAPRIRPRNPADRPLGSRPPPQRTWSGCSRHGHPARLQTVEASRWNDDAVVRRWVRRRDHPLRSFP